MKKTLFLQLSIFFLVIASLHSFSMPQMPANHHAQKAAVSGDELHELTVGNMVKKRRNHYGIHSVSELNPSFS